MAGYPKAIKEDRSHVRWICGSPFSGKTTVAKNFSAISDGVATIA